MANEHEPWTIAAAMLPFPPQDSSGTSAQDVAPERWAAALNEVRREGFTAVDLTDSWLRPGDLTANRLNELAGCLRDTDLRPAAISAIRCSVIDPLLWKENLAYSHRTIDAAAALGVSMVSFGLHRRLSAAQQARTWFWTAPGPRDDPDDRQAWCDAVSRLRDLADHGAQVGVALSLEMYEDTYLGTAESSVALLTDIDRDNVGLNPDTGNLIRSPQRTPESWQEMLERTLPLANYWHVKNYYVAERAGGDDVLAVPAPMSSGLIDYRWAVRFAADAGFVGAFCVEHYGGDRLGVASENRRYLLRLLDDSVGSARARW